MLATGYQPLVQGLFPNHPLPLDERGLPTVLHGEGALAGLHFVGYDIRQPGGLLRTIAMQAREVASAIAQQRVVPAQAGPREERDSVPASAGTGFPPARE